MGWVRISYFLSVASPFLQQSVPQALPLSLQQAAQASLQHFLQASPAAKVEEVTMARAARVVRIAFIGLDQLVGLSCCPLNETWERMQAEPTQVLPKNGKRVEIQRFRRGVGSMKFPHFCVSNQRLPHLRTSNQDLTRRPIKGPLRSAESSPCSTAVAAFAAFAADRWQAARRPQRR